MASPKLHHRTQKHRLQRLDAPSPGVSALIHVIGLASFASSFKYLNDNPNELTLGYGGNFQFLTNIGLGISTATFAAGLIADLTRSEKIFLVKNLLSVCSAPLEVLISVLYWGLCAIDRRLVVPEELELPLSADLGFHLLPALLLTLDLLLLSPPWTITTLPALGISTIIAFGYWFWVEVCYGVNGWYPYPLFATLSTLQRILLFAGSAAVMGANTMVLRGVYAWVNGVEVKEVEREGEREMEGI